MTEKIRLTQYAKGSGCGCKIAPSVLQEILVSGKTPLKQQNLLVGNSSNDDAAVYDLGNGTALLVTTDFFTPVVDDPFVFGKVAAANALSDIYAMGGKPVTAIAILGWPIDKLPAAIAREVMDGASQVCNAAGISIAGGHTIDSPEPFFGLSVNGLVAIPHLKRNTTASEGDDILISKPIGIGVLAAAHKRGLIAATHEAEWIDLLCRLNSIGEVLGGDQAVHAMTDVTGFGLLGHLIEMADGSELAAEISYDLIPRLESSREYIRGGVLPDATYRNWNSYSGKVAIAPTVDAMESFVLLPDPQTNGGLLIAVDPEATEAIIQLGQLHHTEFTRIGKFIPKQEKSVLVN